ncbi:hypothetical protein [Actinomadura litoris]|uniref:hypothetical protein n=1 Tax=Actinomadura litoris TaxID=2678616 RepID=UPI001FA700CB|nr:hypothetical protein [Actinomadura litoris]
MRGRASGASAVMTGADGGTSTPAVETYTARTPCATAPPATSRLPARSAPGRGLGDAVTPIAAAARTTASQPRGAAATAPVPGMAPTTVSTSLTWTSTA